MKITRIFFNWYLHKRFPFFIRYIRGFNCINVIGHRFELTFYFNRFWIKPEIEIDEYDFWFAWFNITCKKKRKPYLFY